MPFKICTNCAAIWDNREEFLKNSNIRLIGYQASFDNPLEGLFLFNHLTKTCGSTISIEVSEFDDMCPGSIYEIAKTGTSECGGHCRRINDLNTCDASCRYAFVREIIQRIKAAQSIPEKIEKA